MGVMLRELDAERFPGSRLRFWLRHGWRRRAASYGGWLAKNPRVRHLEWAFDEITALLARAEGLTRDEAGRRAGEVVREAARHELIWREERDAYLSDCGPARGRAALATAAPGPGGRA